MLAKMWKKVLLAVCIIACLFNIMTKIVNRHSLEVNLESVNDGSVVFDFSKDESKKYVTRRIKQLSDISEGIKKSGKSNPVLLKTEGFWMKRCRGSTCFSFRRSERAAEKRRETKKRCSLSRPMFHVKHPLEEGQGTMCRTEKTSHVSRETWDVF